MTVIYKPRPGEARPMKKQTFKPKHMGAVPPAKKQFVGKKRVVASQRSEPALPAAPTTAPPAIVQRVDRSPIVLPATPIPYVKPSHSAPADVAVVLGTFNRLPFLRQAVESIRSHAGEATYQTIVVDGGSTDGSVEWLASQDDVVLIQQRGPLSGAVKAFNLGFGYAVDNGFPFVCHHNDDARFEGEGTLADAVMELCSNESIGEIGFPYRGPSPTHIMNCPHPSDRRRPYANFGLVRLEAGKRVARAQGDETGRNWWNPIYRTYGADTEFGCWLWALRMHVVPSRFVCVCHETHADEMRRQNLGETCRADSRLWSSRWPDALTLRTGPRPK